MKGYRVNSTHYDALRATLGLTKNSPCRSEIEKQMIRATPVEWAQYAISSIVIKLNNFCDTNIARDLWEAVYINDRMLGNWKFIDKSRLKVGKLFNKDLDQFLHAKLSFR